MQEYIITPDGKTLYDGTIVIIRRFPGTKWILHQGFYSFEGAKLSGWYFVSIPGEATMPMYETDLIGIRVVGGSNPCPPFPPPVPPHPYPPTPPGPCPVPPMSYPYTRYDRDTVYRAAMTVDTVAELHALQVRDIQDGKIVRVNNYEGRIEYFEWSVKEQVWKLLSLGDRYPDISYISDTYATKESVDALDQRLEVVEDTLDQMDWVNMDELVEGTNDG